MKTLSFSGTFDAFPDGTDASKTTFQAGESLPLEDDFADLLIAKGLAVEAVPAEPAIEPKPKKNQE